MYLHKCRIIGLLQRGKRRVLKHDGTSSISWGRLSVSLFALADWKSHVAFRCRKGKVFAYKNVKFFSIILDVNHLGNHNISGHIFGHKVLENFWNHLLVPPLLFGLGMLSVMGFTQVEACILVPSPPLSLLQIDDKHMKFIFSPISLQPIPSFTLRKESGNQYSDKLHSVVKKICENGIKRLIWH